MPDHAALLDRLERLRFPADLGFNRAGTALAATLRPAGRERGQGYQSRIWRFDPAGRAEPAPLTHGPGTDALPRFAPGDDRIAFVSDRALTGRMALHLLDGAEIRPIGDIPGTVEDLAWTADGAALIALAADQGLDRAATDGAVRLRWGADDGPEVTSPAARRRLYRVALADGATAEIGPADATVWEFAPFPAGDAALAIISTDPSERGWYHGALARLDFGRRSAAVLHRSPWQLQGPAIDPQGRRAAFLEGWSSDRGLVAGAVRLIDLATGAVGTIGTLTNVAWVQWRDADSLWFANWAGLGTQYGVLRLDGTVEWAEREEAVIGPSSFAAQITPAPDGTGFAAVRDAPGQPAEIVFKPQPSAGWRLLSALNRAVAAEAAGDPEIRVVRWTGAGGLAMEGFLLLPAGRPQGPAPTIVDIHGGPTWSVKHAFNPGFALPLAAAGYVVFLPNYRGNVGWGQDFARLNIGDPGGAEFADILAGIDWCVAEGIADPARLGVTGASYGGYLTAWAVATTDRFRAAVVVSGITNNWSCHYSCNHGFTEGILGGPLTEPRLRDLALDRSPLWRLDRPTTPTLLLHGAEDRCTPLGQAQEFYAALLERGCPAELAVYPREGHGNQERAHRRDAWERTIGWFDRHLRPAG